VLNLETQSPCRRKQQVPYYGRYIVADLIS